MSAALDLVRWVRDHPANRRRRGRAVARLLGWQVWERVTRRPIWIRIPGGLHLRCYPHSTIGSGVLYCGEPEWPDMPVVRRWLQPGEAFVDIGANIGVYTLLAMSVPDTRAIAFEPSTTTFARLEENLARNQLGSRVRARHAAVGSRSGRARLTIGRDTTNHLTDEGAGDTEEVDLVRLDDELVDLDRQALWKIDVEGFEPEVLAGGLAMLARHHPALIIEANDREALRAVLEPLGYQPVLVDPDRWTVTPRSWQDDHGKNLFLVASLEDTRRRLGEERT